MRISDWSSDVCSSDLIGLFLFAELQFARQFHNNLIGTAVNADDGVQQAAELVQADVDRGIGYPSPTGLVIVVRIKRAGRNFAGEQFAIIGQRSEEHTSELQSLLRISYAVFCLKKQK